MDEFELELKNDFLAEAKDLLLKAESSFMNLESDPTNPGLIDSIFRFAHNLKGTSRAVGFGQIAEITHKVENVLLKIKQGELEISQPVIDSLLLFHDKVAEMIDGLKEDLNAQFHIEDLVHVLNNITDGKASAPAPLALEETACEDDSPTPGAEEFDHQSDVPQSGATIIEMPAALEHEHKTSFINKNISSKKPDSKKDDETIRVSIERLETLSDMVGELIILKSSVEQALTERPSEVKTSRALSKICKDIQKMTMALRMVPVGGAFHKLQRIVRDTSKVLGKKVHLRIIGEETEIDRNVLEKISDPLVHLIRNAVDHGIELPYDRLLSDKTEEGTVEVMAFHEGSFLVIQITDDGAGIDSEKILKKALEKNIISSSQTLPEEEILNLIFHPGFSTKDQVSEVSGRGVGMDVVKTNIEALGGSIKIQSRFGVGSCIRLVLPLTMAIIDGLLVEAASQKIVLPRSQVFEICRFDQKFVQVAAGTAPMFQLRSEVLPLFSLSKKLGEPSGPEAIVLVVRTSSRSFAVSISDVIRQQQVVVKPPTEEISGDSGVMGTTILGDGRPALIIDLFDLFSTQKVKNQHRKAA
jgi:two-component system, chemotaxis family, sensor kinase CheA